MSYAYYNAASRNRDRLSAHHRHGRFAPARRCVCTCPLVGDEEFCRACLARVPEEVRQEFQMTRRGNIGEDRLLGATAAVEQWLRCNPK